jgi:competence protein ComEA
MFRSFLNEYFSFSLSARRGIWILVILIITSFSIPWIYNLIFRNKPKAPDINEIARFDSAFISIKKKEKPKAAYHVNINPFDPNKISKDEWIRLGVKSKIAERIKKYLESGKKFHQKEDVLKIYGFDRKVYSKLSPYFKFYPDTSKQIKNIHLVKCSSKEVKTNFTCLELNKTDQFALNKLPGFDSVLSERVVRYRKLLGGFFRKEQLREVYGLKRVLYDSIKNNVKADTGLITKININEAGEKQLARHPYIGKYKATGIISFRKFNKKITDCNELVKNGILSKDEMEKLRHYLKF